MFPKRQIVLYRRISPPQSLWRVFGVKVNHEKTEALALGDNSLWEDLSNMHTLRNVIKILGIHFGGNDKERDDLNFRETLKSIKKSINLWKWRGLSLLGRIQIIKTFAIPKLMFRASVIPISKELIKNADFSGAPAREARQRSTMGKKIW